MFIRVPIPVKRLQYGNRMPSSYISGTMKENMMNNLTAVVYSAKLWGLHRKIKII